MASFPEPKPSREMGAVFKASMIECFTKTARYVSEEFRNEFIAVGGLALVLHGYNLYTEDIDIVASGRALDDFLKDVENDDKFEFNGLSKAVYKSSFGINVEFEFLHSIGEGIFFEYSQIYVAHALSAYETCAVVSAQDLLRMKAHAWIDRKKDKDIEAVKALLWILRSRGDKIGVKCFNKKEKSVLKIAIEHTSLVMDKRMARDWEVVISEEEECCCGNCIED